MDWKEIIITVAVEQTEKAENIAHMVVPYGIYVEDYSDLEEAVREIAKIDLIEEELLAKDRTKSKIHIYVAPDKNPMEAVSFLRERYQSENIAHEISMEDCKDEDWIYNWRKYFRPIKIGDKLLIQPIWEDEQNDDTRTVLHLEPGLAFGTGTHETTRLCLKLLEEFIATDIEVLDVGCGSGILSVAALLLGAKNATGVDIDSLAVKTAIENAERNGVEKRFKAVLGDLTEQINEKYDLVVANIVADVIIDLSKKVKPYLNNGAIYIMSGIIDTRAEEVKQSLLNDFTIIKECEEGSWVAIVAKLR